MAVFSSKYCPRIDGSNNDSSILENYHIALGWEVLQRPGNNFLHRSSEKEFNEFKKNTIEIILATDVSGHKAAVEDFKAKHYKDGMFKNNFDWKSKQNRLDMLKMTIRMADGGTPCKPWNIYQRWAKAVQEEFYLQGDEEKKLGIDVTPNCDRRRVNELEVQIKFIKFSTLPILEILTDARALRPVSFEKDAIKDWKRKEIEFRHNLMANLTKLEGLTKKGQKLPRGWCFK
ncbi:hypothetical protein ACOME3_009281 [Neoechinorhynchus agilis]